MKKIVSLVLAAAMLSTTAMAADLYIGTGIPSGASSLNAVANDAEANRANPGKTINIAADSFVNTSTNTNTLAGIGWRLSTEYFTIGSKKFDKGANLVKEVKINDDKNTVQIVLNDNYELTAPVGENLVIKDLTLKAKKSYDLNNDKSYTAPGNIKKSATYEYDTTNLDVAFRIGYAKASNKVDFNLKQEYILGERVEFINDSDDSVVYETVSASFGDVYLEGRVYDGDKVYLDINADVNKDVLKSNDTAAIRFYNIVTSGLSTANTIQITADEEEFLYKVVDGKLVESGLKWSADDYAWVGKVRTNTSYVISDIKLNASAAADGTDKPATSNPDTGANDVVGIAAALAVVSLVAAGAVSLKK